MSYFLMKINNKRFDQENYIFFTYTKLITRFNKKKKKIQNCMIEEGKL